MGLGVVEVNMGGDSAKKEKKVKKEKEVGSSSNVNMDKYLKGDK